MNSLPAVRRATLEGYLFVPFGLVFVSDGASATFSTGPSILTLSTTALGLFAIGAGVMTWLHPDRDEHGSEPAPRYFFVLAGISTLACAFVLFDTLT